MSTNPQKTKRETKQARLGKDIHAQMRVVALNTHQTLSHLLDEICMQYLEHSNSANRANKTNPEP
jgi:hypothetical protein